MMQWNWHRSPVGFALLLAAISIAGIVGLLLADDAFDAPLFVVTAWPLAYGGWRFLRVAWHGKT